MFFSLNDMFRELFSHFQVNKYLHKKADIYLGLKKNEFHTFIKGLCKSVTKACKR